MSRLILLFAVVAVVYWLLRSYLKPSPKQTPSKASEEMVRCVQCGVHLPKSESIMSGGEFFCSDEHRRSHAERSK